MANLAEARAKAAAPTGPFFREFAEQYIEARTATWRSAKHADQWSATLKSYAYPVIGKMTLAEIDTPHALAEIGLTEPGESRPAEF